jgi:hypothetical protein
MTKEMITTNIKYEVEVEIGSYGPVKLSGNEKM